LRGRTRGTRLAAPRTPDAAPSDRSAAGTA